MLRPILRTTVLFAVVAAFPLPSAKAQNANTARYGAPVPIQQRTQIAVRPQYDTRQMPSRNAALVRQPQTVIVQPAPDPNNQRVVAAYPYLNAPLYTCPQQNIPYQVGSAVITNQAFAPHEMLYEHDYKAMYPPFYHKVDGHWFVTPWGVWSAENWELQGTTVEVNYRRHKPPFNLFTPPWLH